MNTPVARSLGFCMIFASSDFLSSRKSYVKVNPDSVELKDFSFKHPNIFLLAYSVNTNENFLFFNDLVYIVEKEIFICNTQLKEYLGEDLLIQCDKVLFKRKLEEDFFNTIKISQLVKI